MINWKVRVRQKWFWLTIIPAVLMLLDQRDDVEDRHILRV